MFSAPTGYWQSLKAGLFRIDEMDDEHLSKCIELLHGNLAREHYEREGVEVSTAEAKLKLGELLAEQARRH